MEELRAAKEAKAKVDVEKREVERKERLNHEQKVKYMQLYKELNAQIQNSELAKRVLHPQAFHSYEDNRLEDFEDL